MKIESEKGTFVLYKHTCNHCGKIFYTRTTGDRWCSKDCLKLHRRSIQQSVKQQKWADRVKETQLQIRDIVRLANEAGVSYGEYVARFHM